MQLAEEIMSATTGYTLLSASDGPLSSNMSYDEFQMRLEVRDFGLDWRASAHRFLDSPSDSSRHQAERALDEYARRLRSLSPVSPYTNLTVRAFALKAAPTLLTAASGLALPEYGAYVATVGTTGYLAYQYLYKGMRQKVRIDLRANVIAAK
jgi:hypothetical protein